MLPRKCGRRFRGDLDGIPFTILISQSSPKGEGCSFICEISENTDLTKLNLGNNPNLDTLLYGIGKTEIVK